MQKLPHTYTASAQGGGEGGLRVETEEGFQFECFPPSHFGGPEGVQSPEYLLSEAMASCLVLTFRAIAKASGLDWENLNCVAEGRLDKEGGMLSFSSFVLRAVLTISLETDIAKADSLLHKAEKYCLISSSLNCAVELKTEIKIT